MLLSGESIWRNRAQLPGFKIFQGREIALSERFRAKWSVRLAVNPRCEDVKIVGRKIPRPTHPGKRWNLKSPDCRGQWQCDLPFTCRVDPAPDGETFSDHHGPAASAASERNRCGTPPSKCNSAQRFSIATRRNGACLLSSDACVVMAAASCFARSESATAARSSFPDHCPN